MTRRRSLRVVVAVGLAIAVGLALFLSPHASGAPDGLNRVAADHGFDGRAEVRGVQDDAPIPGYAFPGIRDAAVAKGVAGGVGTLGVFAVGYGLAAVLRLRVRRSASDRMPAGTA